MTPEPALTTAVVVCAYTTARWGQLQAAVRSAVEQTPPPVEVVVVVDHCEELLSSAKTLEQPAVAGQPGVRVVASTGTRGLSGARNTGVVAVATDVVAFLDDDAVACPGWLAELARHFADPGVVGVGGRVEPAWAGPEPAWLPPEFRWVVGCSYSGLPAVTAEVRNPIGASMAFRRQPLLDVGGFSTTVGRVGTRPLGCEETELSIRLARHVPGARVLYEPRSVVQHHVPADRTRWSYFRQRCWAEGLSKARVAALSDPRHALSAERRYAARVLPRGIARDLRGAAGTGEAALLARAGASVAGLAVTAAGYTAGRLFQPTSAQSRPTPLKGLTCPPMSTRDNCPTGHTTA
jgi:GT2 family glycosyltransferase